MKCAVYVRVSTEDNNQETSIQNQTNLFENFIMEKGWELYKVYTEVESDCIGIEELIKDAKDKKFNIVLINECSWLLQNDVFLNIFIPLFPNNIYFITLDGVINTLEDERSSISKRINDSNMVRALNGFFNKAPFGYTIKDGKLYLANDGTPEIVKRIYKEYIEGRSFSAIACSLNNEGVSTPAKIKGYNNAGTNWKGSSIRQILEKDVYIGRLVAKKTTISPTTNKRILNKPENWIVVENTHEAIISKKEFDLVQQLIKSRKHFLSKK